MARTNATNFTGGLQFPYATAATDIFKKEDIQTLAQAVDQHNHTAGKGLSVTPANASITNAMLGSDVARANLLTNGGFEIWQRGNGPFTVSGAFTADRWVIYPVGTDTLSVQRSANIPPNTGSVWCATCILVLGSGAGGTAIAQTLKQADGDQIQGRTFTFSIAVYTTVAGAVRAFASADGSGTPNITSAFHPGDSTYHTLSVTITVPQNATGLNIGCYFAASTGANCFLDNAMLVVGSQPADYVPLHPADDLARCLRYYEILGEQSGEITWSAAAYAAGNFDVPIGYKARKAVSPTVTKNGTWGVANVSQPTVVGSGLGVVSLRFAATGAGQASALNNAVGANVSIEANP